MPAEQFRSQLQFLKSRGCVVECVQQLEARLREGGGIPEAYVVLTCDDGDTSAPEAAEILCEFGFKASFFVTRDKSLGGYPFVSPSGIRELRRRGFSLGTHGTTHRRFSSLSEKECIAELRESKQWLEDLIGEPVRYMSTPHGAVNRRILELARQQGYVLVATSRESINYTRQVALSGHLSRVAVRRHYSLRQFAQIVDGDPSFYLWRRVHDAGRSFKRLVLTGERA